MTLNVFLFDNFAGTLSTTADRGIIFKYDDNYINNKGMALSLSLPVRKEEYSQKECLPYFSGLLPEGEIKRQVSNFFHVSESSTVKLLELLGGECSGTVSFFNSDEIDVEHAIKTINNSWELSEKNYRKLSENDIANYIRNSVQRPFLTSDDDLRLSLAGAQNKVSLAYFDNSWHLPINGAPSTHILKPTRIDLDTIAANEFICMNIANQLGIEVASSKLVNFEDIPVFICDRYDRQIDLENHTIKRLHQEDFCQALGIMNDKKYQADGGPSLKDCFNLIKNNCSGVLKNTQQFISVIIFNYLIGNCDSHGKNYSIIFEDNKSPCLAPFYDLVSTQIYPGLTTKMAMKLGGEYEITKIMRDDFTKQADMLGLKPYSFFNKIDEFSKQINKAFDVVEKYPEVKEYSSLIKEIRGVIESKDIQS